MSYLCKTPLKLYHEDLFSLQLSCQSVDQVKWQAVNGVIHTGALSWSSIVLFGTDRKQFAKILWVMYVMAKGGMRSIPCILQLATCYLGVPDLMILCFKSYIYVGGSDHKRIQPSGTTWVYPQIALLSRPANKITQWLRDLRCKIPSLPEDVEGTGFRVGAALTIVNHPECELIHALFRGDWDCTGLCNIFEYIIQSQTIMSVAGAALAGWNNVRRQCYPPRCVFINADNRDLVHRFVNFIFEHAYGNKLDHLFDLKLVWFASLLQYLERFIASFTVNHIIVQTLYFKASMKDFAISLETLLEWGSSVERDWYVRNLQNITAGDTADAISNLTAALANQQSVYDNKIKDLESIIIKMKNEFSTVFQRQSTVNAEMMNLLRSIRLDQTDTSPVKTPRKRLKDHLEEDLLNENAVEESAHENDAPPISRISFSRKDTNGYTSSQCVHDYITFKLDTVSNWSDPHKSQKHIRSMVTRVASFYLHHANDEEINSFISEPPPVGSSAWQQWHRTWKTQFENLERRVGSILKDEEERLQVEKAPKTFSNSLSALDKRLTRIKWQSPSAQVYSEADSSNFMSYFGRK